jgi:hypothetical protein
VSSSASIRLKGANATFQGRSGIGPYLKLNPDRVERRQQKGGSKDPPVVEL